MVSKPVKPTESEKPIDRERILDLNEAVEDMEEEVEYEEVEEEVEEEEEIEEEVAEEEAAVTNGVEDNANKDEDESTKHAELLSLPPHGSEVYVGGIPGDATAEDLKCFCESVGEVVEVSHIYLICSLLLALDMDK